MDVVDAHLRKNAEQMSDSSEDTTQSSSRFWWDLHLWQMKPIQDVFWLILAVSLIWAGYILRGVFIPMLVAFAAAYTVEPWLVQLEKRWQLPRTLVISGGVVLASIAGLAATIVLGPQIVAQVDQLIGKTPVYVATVADLSLQYTGNDWLRDIFRGQFPGINEQLIAGGAQHVEGTMRLLIDAVSGTSYFITAILLIPIYFVFIAWNYGPLLERLKELLPSANRDRILQLAARMDSAVGNFIRGRLSVCFWMILMFSTGFWLVDVPYWFLLGCGTGMLSFIPFAAVIGCVMAVVVQCLEASTTGGNGTWLQAAMWPVLVYCLVQLFEGWVLTPWIQSQSMSMSPVTVFVVLMIGGSLGGLYGLLLAIPLAGCLRVLGEELLTPKLESWAADASRS